MLEINIIKSVKETIEPIVDYSAMISNDLITFIFYCIRGFTYLITE